MAENTESTPVHMYAQIAVNTAVYMTFTYEVPPALVDDIRVGHLVRVPFRTATIAGIVVSFSDTTDIPSTKAIETLIDPDPVVTPEQIALAEWISETCLAPIGMCLWLWVPTGLAGYRDVRLTLLKPDYQPEGDNAAAKAERELVNLLKRRGTLRYRQQIRPSIGRKVSKSALEKAIRRLIDASVLSSRSILTPPRVKPQTIDTVQLAIPPENIHDILRYLGKRSRRADLLEAIADMTTEDAPDVEINDVLQAVGASRSTLNKLEREEGLVELDGGYVRLAIPHDDVVENLVVLRRGQTQHHVLRMLAREDDPIDVSWVYAQTGAKLDDLKALDELELVTFGEKQTWRDSLAEREFEPTEHPPLTEAQMAVWQVVKEAIENPSSALPEFREGIQHATEINSDYGLTHASAKDKTSSDVDSTSNPNSGGKHVGVRGEGKTFLLHGVTGSGKTEIYLRAMDAVLAQGRQAIFLVPEIALTAQTVRRVAARFATKYPGKVAVVHSGLSEGERFDTWRRARAGKIAVVVGARSALFTPFPDVGLIVIDEEHDTSYKNISTPTYDTRQVAEAMMKANNGILILGSATPSLEMYTWARFNTHDDPVYLHLPDRIMGHRTRINQQAEREGVAPRYISIEDSADEAMTIDLPPVEVVDMRVELKRGNTSMFSESLDTAIQSALKRHEQSILLLNRRGMSTYVFCRDCGYVAKSPESDLPLTYHQYGHYLMDHHNGKTYPIPKICPECGSSRIKYFGAGTQQVEAEIEKHYPSARVVRWDRDTASKSDMHDAILSRFLNHDADIMVGTQMIAKGLDLPLVTLVGVVSADVGLGLPDFRAAERTFQLLTQVAGRAGRGLLGGQVILQTYQPEHYVIQAASTHDVEGFYARELDYRREMGYPPFRRLARIIFRDKNEARARSDAEHAAEILRKVIADHELSATELIGPAPCFFAKLSDQYRWHLLIRSPDPVHLLSLTHAAAKWHIEIDPVDVL